MNLPTESALQKTTKSSNPLATLFFIFGLFHVYNLVENKGISSFILIFFLKKIISPILSFFFLGLFTGETFIEVLTFFGSYLSI